MFLSVAALSFSCAEVLAAPPSRLAQCRVRYPTRTVGSRKWFQPHTEDAARASPEGQICCLISRSMWEPDSSRWVLLGFAQRSDSVTWRDTQKQSNVIFSRLIRVTIKIHLCVDGPGTQGHTTAVNFNNQ